MKKKDTRLYNVLFPIWLFYLLPTKAWLWIIPANFLIDSLVIWLSARRQGLEAKTVWKKRILSAWIFGFVSDFLGAGVVYVIYAALSVIPAVPNLIRFPWTTLISIPGVIVAGVLIYFLNKKETFRKSGLDAAEIHRLCLRLAAFTAPYAMLIPIYG